MNKLASLAIAAISFAFVFAPHSVAAQSQAAKPPACSQDDWIIPSGPHVVTRDCFPNGTLKVWTEARKGSSMLFQHDRTGTIVRQIMIFHDNFGVEGWQMNSGTVDTQGRIVEQVWVASASDPGKMPTQWHMFAVNVYANAADQNHEKSLVGVLFYSNGQPGFVNVRGANNTEEHQHYRLDGTLEYSLTINHIAGTSVRKDYTARNNYRLPAGVLDPSWLVMPDLTGVPVPL